MSPKDSWKKKVSQAVNSEGFIDHKYRLKHHAKTLSTVLQDFQQSAILKKDSYLLFEQKLRIGTLFLSVSNICNASCAFCAYKTSTHKKGVMEFSTFKKAIDEFVEMNGTTISLTPTAGDPLVDSNIFEKISYAVKQKSLSKIYFYTNGILLAKNEAWKKLIDSGLTEINVSTIIKDRETYSALYGVDAYEQVTVGIQSLLEYNRQKGEPVRIILNFRSHLSPSRIIRSDDFKKIVKPFLSEKVSFEFLADYDNWGGEITRNELVGALAMRRIPRKKILPCQWTFNAGILFDGSVRLCAARLKKTEFDELVIGNILKTPLKELFYGSKGCAVRKRFSENNLAEVCKDCSLYQPATQKWLENRITEQNQR